MVNHGTTTTKYEHTTTTTQETTTTVNPCPDPLCVPNTQGQTTTTVGRHNINDDQQSDNNFDYVADLDKFDIRAINILLDYIEQHDDNRPQAIDNNNNDNSS